MRKVLYATTALVLCASARAQTVPASCKQTFSQNFSSGLGSFVTGSDYAQCPGSMSSQMSSYVVSQSCGAGANPAASVYQTGSNGLTLQVKPTPASVAGQVGNAPFLGSEATTKGTFSQEYGYFEMTASMPQGAGLNPAFWLLPASGAWPPELDIVEMPTGSSGGGHIAYQTLHSTTLGNQEQGSATVANPTAMHTYAVDWEANTVTWYVDGVQTYQVPTPSDLHQPMYMLLDLFSGTPGSWEGAPAPGETASFNVQSVQAYSCNPGTAVTQPVTPPAATTPSTCAATPGGAATGGFTTSNGNIIAPDGSVFIAKGIDVMEGDQPSATTLVSDFPGINFVRFAVYDYAGASTLNAFVSDLTSRNIVVEIEHHVGAGGGVPPLAGADLAAENAWFQALATAFKSNPYVWFGTLNEPGGPDATLAAEQASNYGTIRGTGNNTIIMFSMNVTPPPVATAGMTNVVVDQHYYGWVSGYSTDQATVTAALTKAIGTDQQLTGTTGKLPVIIGEYGNSTTGTSIDANAQQVLTAVQSSGYGSAAWAWGTGNPGDGLTAGSGGLSSYGQEVAGYIALIANAPASVWACPESPRTTAATAPGTAGTTTVVAQTTAPADNQPAATTTGPPAASVDTTAQDATAAAQQAAAQAAIAAADAQAPAVAATVQQTTAAGVQTNAGLASVLATIGGGQ